MSILFFVILLFCNFAFVFILNLSRVCVHVDKCVCV